MQKLGHSGALVQRLSIGVDDDMGFQAGEQEEKETSGEGDVRSRILVSCTSWGEFGKAKERFPNSEALLEFVRPSVRGGRPTHGNPSRARDNNG
jgi:hypothetical protein